MVASLALFALLVTFDNLTDYDTNYAFVHHVLSMDTTFPGNALLYRRVTLPALWQAGYGLIIAGEGLTASPWQSRLSPSSGICAPTASALIVRSVSRSSARPSGFWCGFSVSWSLAASGIRCGNHRCGMARRRHFAFK